MTDINYVYFLCTKQHNVLLLYTVLNYTYILSMKNIKYKIDTMCGCTGKCIITQVIPLKYKKLYIALDLGWI